MRRPIPVGRACAYRIFLPGTSANRPRHYNTGIGGHQRRSSLPPFHGRSPWEPRQPLRAAPGGPTGGQPSVFPRPGARLFLSVIGPSPFASGSMVDPMGHASKCVKHSAGPLAGHRTAVREYSGGLPQAPLSPPVSHRRKRVWSDTADPRWRAYPGARGCEPGRGEKRPGGDVLIGPQRRLVLTFWSRLVRLVFIGQGEGRSRMC